MEIIYNEIISIIFPAYIALSVTSKYDLSFLVTEATLFCHFTGSEARETESRSNMAQSVQVFGRKVRYCF